MNRFLAPAAALLLAACTRKPAPAVAEIDTTTIHTSVGMGGSLVVPRFVGTWVRPVAGHAGQMEALVMARGGGMRFQNICSLHGVSWAEIPGDTLALTSAANGAGAPTERHFHIVRFTDSLLAIEGSGYEAGSWQRSAAQVENSCPGP